MSLILILLFFFAKLNEMEDGNINHLIGDGSIKNLFFIKWQKKFLCDSIKYIFIYYNLINLR